MSHLEKNILYPEQHGFRCGRSCETQRLGYMDETSEELERGNQEDTIVLDYEKAFDKVSHTLLVHKLRCYGIEGRLNEWIDSFLENRQQAVVVGGERSNFMPVDSGVPQGSVVDPCLFLLYINDLPIDTESKIRLFADDTLCSNIIKHKEDQKKLQKALDSLTIWEKQWSLSFHPQKFYTLSATRKKKKIVPSYHLHGHNLQNVSTAKYLGINIQDNLNWRLHMDTITNKANKTLGFLRRNLKIGNKKTKETAYKAFVRPILEYSANDIKTIEKVQRRAARWVTNRHHQTSCVNSIIDSLAWPTLQQRQKKAQLEMFYNFHHRLVTIDFEYLPLPTD